jgi:hypothetical protein
MFRQVFHAIFIAKIENKTTGKPPKYIKQHCNCSPKNAKCNCNNTQKYSRKEQKLSKKRARPAKPY